MPSSIPFQLSCTQWLSTFSRITLGLGIIALSLSSISNANHAHSQDHLHYPTRHPSSTVMAEVQSPKGKSLGTVEFIQIGHDKGLLRADLHDVPQGWHGFHLHQTGTCTPPDFKSAGGHFNPHNHDHGIGSHHGKHIGDLPNIYVTENGSFKGDFFVAPIHLTHGSHPLMDLDGAALVIHDSADDYETNPAGNAGPRIGCGVFTPSTGHTTDKGQPDLEPAEQQ